MIRLMREEDLEAAAELEKQCFSVPWSKKSLQESLSNPDYLFLAAEKEGKVVGYAGLLKIVEEGDVTNIAVLPNCRKQGIGTALTEALIREGQKAGLSSFTLEVRASNEAAISIYEKLGFRSAGVRKGFYDSPKEDALIMWLTEP